MERLTGRLHPRGTDGLLYVAQLLGELSIPWRSAGGNEIRVPADLFDRMPDEYRVELADVVRDVVPGVPAAHVPPGGGADSAGTGAATVPTEPPPRTGPGSSRDAWAEWATSNGVPVPEGAGRDEIIELMEAHTRGR